MDTKKDIKQFIANVADKNYSAANRSLSKMIENKLKTKIKAALTQEK